MLIGGNMAISLLMVAVGLPLVALRTRRHAARLRLVAARTVAGDLRLGLIGFVMLAPPVYAMQGLLVYFWQPSKHPLMEMFKASPDPGFFALLFVAAAIVAPLFEELMFRVLLQGFLEKAVQLSRAMPRSCSSARRIRALASLPIATHGIVRCAGELLSDPNPFAPSRDFVSERQLHSAA